MKIDASAKCTPYEACDTYSPIPLQVDKSVKVLKTNTLHQFDFAQIVGVPSPVGKVPILFYVKEAEGRGRRGIIYQGDDLDSVCWLWPESEHAEWCKQPYDMKYDGLEPFDNGVERGLRRNWGILELWVSVWRKWYNGQIMYKPYKKLKNCVHDFEGYPGKSTVEIVEEKKTERRVLQAPRKKKVNHGCGCRKGV